MPNYPFLTTGFPAAFCAAVAFILQREGALDASFQPTPTLGYVCDPDDLGGETKGGISKRSYPHLDIAALTLDRIVRIYYRDFYKPMQGSELPAAIALMAFDACVQHGATNATLMLQEISDCTADGKIGPITLRAVHCRDVNYLIARYGLRRAQFYARILIKKPSQAKYIDGWHNRLVLLTNAAWELTGDSL